MNNRLNTMENETNEEMEAPKPPADHNPSLSEPSSPEPPQTNPNPIAAARTHESRFEAIHAPGRRRTSTTSSSSPSSSISSHCTSTPTPTPTHARPPTSSSQPLSRATTQRDTPNPLERSDTALSRIQTQRSQHEATVGGSHLSRRATRQSALPLPAFGGGKAYPPLLPDREEYVVEFEGEGDPRHPFNWSRKRKLRIAGTLGFATFCSAFGSSIFSAGTLVVARQFGVSREVGILGVSLYVLGFAMGPLLWGPLSELKGRRLPMLISMFGFTIFQFAVATAKDLQTIIICRFWAGFFAAAPLALVGASFADIYDNDYRGSAITVFSTVVFCGPLIAPSIGGFIVMNPSLGWPWTQYITGMMGGLAFVLLALFGEETYAPILLVQKAEELRRRTQNWGIHAKQEEIEIDFVSIIQKNFARPFVLLFTEPVVLCISLYMAFVYGVLYVFLTALPIAFQQIRGFNPGVGGLPFFGMVAGMLLAGAFILYTQSGYRRKLAANHNIPVPEWRLPPVIAGAVAFAIGLFWFGWTGYRADIHWIAPTLSGVFTGFGLLSIFLQLLNYLIDAYLMFSASVIAASTVLRSLAGAVFVLWASYMFEGLGINWGCTLLGFLAVAFIPVPVGLYVFGRRIRARSKIAPGLDLKVGPEAERLRREGKSPDMERRVEGGRGVGWNEG